MTDENFVPEPGDFVPQTQIDKQWERPGLEHQMIGVPVTNAPPFVSFSSI